MGNIGRLLLPEKAMFEDSLEFLRSLASGRTPRELLEDAPDVTVMGC